MTSIRIFGQIAAVTGLLVPALALAHVGQGDISGGFVAGFQHPVLGLDHVVAMVAVGLWGAQLGAPAIWVLPIIFPLVMALGGLLGGSGVPLPGVEIGIAASAVALGLMALLAARPPLWSTFCRCWRWVCWRGNGGWKRGIASC